MLRFEHLGSIPASLTNQMICVLHIFLVPPCTNVYVLPKAKNLSISKSSYLLMNVFRIFLVKRICIYYRGDMIIYVSVTNRIGLIASRSSTK